MNAFCALIVLTVAVVGVKSQTNASGITTRYWDCCKPSCAWSGKATTVNSQAVKTCAQDGVTVLGPNSINACGGGGSGGPTWMCSADQPWAVNSSLAFGFAAANIQGLTEPQWCCACYELIFTSTAVANKKMVVQVTNTGGDLSGNHFDIQIPGGGFGIFNGCASQFPSTPANNWGAQYGGISSQSQCSGLPAALQPGCNWRWTWYLGADNPNMLLTRTVCPKSIVAKTGCQRTDDSTISYNKYASL